MNQDGGFVKVLINHRKSVYSLLKKKPPLLQNSSKYISGESTLSPGETTPYSGRNDSRSGQNDSGRTGHRAKRRKWHGGADDSSKKIGLLKSFVRVS